MGESQNQKFDELIAKLKAFGQKVKSTRDGFGQPLADRVGTRLDRLLTQHNGDSNPRQPQQPQEPKVVCPKCGHSFSEDIAFCSTCGFSFQEQKREQAKAVFEREQNERNSRIGVITGG
jgi:ribosomal protein L37E